MRLRTTKPGDHGASSALCAEFLVALPAATRARVRRRRAPAWVQPMLATLVATPFSDPGWVYERKLDGVRCLAFRRGRAVRLLSRNQLALDGAFPELAAAVAGAGEH